MKILTKFKQQNKLQQMLYLLVIFIIITLLVGCLFYFRSKLKGNPNSQTTQLNFYKNISLEWKKKYIDIIKDYYEEHQDKGDSKYSLYDINNDGIPELFLNSWYRDNLVYTFSNDKVVLVGETYNELYKGIDNIGVISYGGWGTGIGGAILYTLEDFNLKEENILLYDATLPSNPITYKYMGQQVNQERFEEELLKITANPLKMYNIEKNITEENLVY